MCRPEQLASTFQIRFFDEDVRRQPQAGLKVQPPAVKMQVIAVAGMRRICPVEADNVVVTVFHPDPAQEPSAHAVLGLNVDHNAAHLPKELLTYKFEVVVLLLKVAIEHDHLGKAEGHELPGKQAGKWV